MLRPTNATAIRREAPAAPVAQPTETAGELTPQQFAWVQANAKHWEREGRVRYYIDRTAAMKLAEAIDESKGGEPIRILGLSKTKTSQQLLSWEVYFDAVGGKLIQGRTKEDIFQALWWGLENRI